MKMKSIKTCLTLPALLVAGSLVCAEPLAPVYDVDGMSNDSQSSSGVVQDNRSKAALDQALISSSDEPPASVEQRLDRLEQQLANAQQKETVNRLNSMQGEVQALRSQVEELTHQLQVFRSQQRDQHAEADKLSNKELSEQAVSPFPRVSDEESGASPKTAQAKLAAKQPGASSLERRSTLAKLAAPERSVKKLAPVAEQPKPNVAEEQAVYQTAYDLIKVKKYNDAIAALQKMLVKYPSGLFAANAHYWLGELYSLTNENEKAAAEFSTVVKQYPSNPRVADAELKLGLINATLLKWPAAKASFKKVVASYPGTTSAHLAMEQLKLLKQAGH